jgi:hypothetical protein
MSTQVLPLPFFVVPGIEPLSYTPSHIFAKFLVVFVVVVVVEV